MGIFLAGLAIGLGLGIFTMLAVFSRQPAPRLPHQPQPLEPWNYQ